MVETVEAEKRMRKLYKQNNLHNSNHKYSHAKVA